MRLIFIGSIIAFFVSILGTPLLFKFLRQHNYAQAIR